MRHSILPLLAGVLALALLGPIQAKDAPAPAKASSSQVATAPAAEDETRTSHEVTIGGRSYKYEATAGTLIIRDDKNQPQASVFYAAYTVGKDGGKGSPRPVTFLYNGGPGSSSLWLHMGSLGPVRVETASPSATGPAPYHVIPNDDSLLDKSDLVFIDAVGAGYSRPVGKATGKDFWGVDQDISAFARAIERYVEKNQRWNSPKFLFGESYGTTRSAGLVDKLQDDGMAINGVVLLSSILNYAIRLPGYDELYIGYMPSYAATAWYHDKVPNKPASLPEFIKQVEQWARGPYTAALAKGSNLPAAELDSVAQQMAAYTGLSVDYIKSANLRVDLSRFRKELLRDQRLTIGRFDSRFTGTDQDAAGENPGYDPSSTGITGAFVSAFHAYLAGQLNYHSALEYRTSAPGANRNWDWKHKAPGMSRELPLAYTAIDLAHAIRTNPRLQVLSANGYYDMATPFFNTEYDLAHMQLDPPLRGNVHFTYYPSGHMVYLNTDALKQLKADLVRFYDGATAKP